MKTIYDLILLSKVNVLEFLILNNDMLPIDKIFEYAVMMDKIEVVKFFIDKRNYDLSRKDGYALVIASMYGNLNMLRYLKDNGGHKLIHSNKVLIAACKGGYIDIIKFLLSVGVNLSLNNGDALLKATRYGRRNVIDFLLYHGVDIHSQNDKALDEATILIDGKDKEDIISFYLRKRLNIHFSNDRIFTRLLRSKKFDLIYLILSLYESEYKNLDKIHELAYKLNVIDTINDKDLFVNFIVDYYNEVSKVKVTLTTLFRVNIPHIIENILSFHQHVTYPDASFLMR
jgi:ankyrin repeat protein